MKENRPSLTSLAMANMILVLGGSTTSRTAWLAPGCWETQIELLAACGLPFGGVSRMAYNPLLSNVVRQFSDIVVQPQALECLGFRKSWIEQQVRQSLSLSSPTPSTTTLPTIKSNDSSIRTATRARQLLVVGAGYDTLALRLANEQYNGRRVRDQNSNNDDDDDVTTFWEVDHPATGRVKERGLQRLLQSPNSVQSIHVDLTKNKLSDILPKTPGYDCHAPTVVVLEGLTYYLPVNVLYQLFQDIGKVVGPKSRVVFDFFVTSADGRRPILCQSPWINGLLLDLVQLVGEPMYPSPTTSTTTKLPKNTRSARRHWVDAATLNANANNDDDYSKSMANDLATFFRQEQHERQGTPYWKVVTPVQAVGFERLVVVELTQPPPPA